MCYGHLISFVTICDMGQEAAAREVEVPHVLETLV